MQCGNFLFNVFWAVHYVCRPFYIIYCVRTFLYYKNFTKNIKIFTKLFGKLKNNVYICTNKNFKQTIQFQEQWTPLGQKWCQLILCEAKCTTLPFGISAEYSQIE